MAGALEAVCKKSNHDRTAYTTALGPRLLHLPRLPTQPTDHHHHRRLPPVDTLTWPSHTPFPQLIHTPAIHLSISPPPLLDVLPSPLCLSLLCLLALICTASTVDPNSP